LSTLADADVAADRTRPYPKMRKCAAIAVAATWAASRHKRTIPLNQFMQLHASKASFFKVEERIPELLIKTHSIESSVDKKLIVAKVNR